MKRHGLSSYPTKDFRMASDWRRKKKLPSSVLHSRVQGKAREEINLYITKQKRFGNLQLDIRTFAATRLKPKCFLRFISWTQQIT